VGHKDAVFGLEEGEAAASLRGAGVQEEYAARLLTEGAVGVSEEGDLRPGAERRRAEGVEAELDAVLMAVCEKEAQSGGLEEFRERGRGDAVTVSPYRMQFGAGKFLLQGVGIARIVAQMDNEPGLVEPDGFGGGLNGAVGIGKNSNSHKRNHRSFLSA